MVSLLEQLKNRRNIENYAQLVKDVEAKLVVTNMHLLPNYGSSYKEIENDGFKIDYRVNMSLDGYNHYTHAKSLGASFHASPYHEPVAGLEHMERAGNRGEGHSTHEDGHVSGQMGQF